ncbi:MAG TPA: hypothetical protein VIM73_03035 [Polyangiaceae bacterium]
METVAEKAIKRSVSHNEIVTIDFDAEGRDELRVSCEGYADNKAYGVEEYWGTLLSDVGETIGEWRVHMRVEVAS